MQSNKKKGFAYQFNQKAQYDNRDYDNGIMIIKIIRVTPNEVDHYGVLGLVCLFIIVGPNKVSSQIMFGHFCLFVCLQLFTDME